MTILEKIDNIETAIFDYEITNVMNNTVSVFSEIIDGGAIDINSQNMLNRLNILMGECLSAMQNKDYLLLADQLEYKLKPLLGADTRIGG